MSMNVLLRGSKNAVSRARSMLSILEGGSGYKSAAGSKRWSTSPWTCPSDSRSFSKNCGRLSKETFLCPTRTATIALPAPVLAKCKIAWARIVGSISGCTIMPTEIKRFSHLPCRGSFAGPKCLTRVLSTNEMPGRSQRQSIGSLVRRFRFLQSGPCDVVCCWGVELGDDSNKLNNAKSIRSMKVRLQGHKQPSDPTWRSPHLWICQTTSQATLPDRKPKSAASKACCTADEAADSPYFRGCKKPAEDGSVFSDCFSFWDSTRSTCISRIATHSFWGLSMEISKQRLPRSVPCHVSSASVSSFNLCGSWQFAKVEAFKEPSFMKSCSCLLRLCLMTTLISPLTGSSNTNPDSLRKMNQPLTVAN